MQNRGVTLAKTTAVAALFASACANVGPAAGPRPSAVGDGPTHAAVLRRYAATLPRCADGESAMTVEDLLAASSTRKHGTCERVRGRLVVDAGAGICQVTHDNRTCTANWYLLGTPRVPEPQRLPGVRAYVPDAHSMIIQNFAADAEPVFRCVDDPDAWEPREVRLTSSVWSPLPLVEQGKAQRPEDHDLTDLEVVMLVAFSECPTCDPVLLRICRVTELR